ncbi:hypothetical protein HH310_24270 [Actinoplanes sp. TBRC 11911]|uniref:hypothetical protein n=1 Tax=Actinoplanes sp. TBRC 11911 TaxID=2729386 RepID=UPI00145C56E4|nr:hypothetical protein [Actinoplanes sp. TBRC 11911]NMO54287.1 hypothetical protein [Actinoplanes sp. TBRC 11911]
MTAAPGAVPYRLWIGVTGHRHLADVEHVTRVLDDLVDRIPATVPVSDRTSLQLGVVSPLAEGADRLVAKAVLRHPGATLEVALPLPPEEYKRDFATEESRQEFDELLRRAQLVTVLPQAGNRQDAYQRVGHYVVNRSDVIIAVWDREPSRGKGGTAEIVAHARDRGTPLFLVAPQGEPEVEEEPGHGFPINDYREIDDFNDDEIPSAEFSGEISRQTDRLLTDSRAAGLADQAVKPYLAWSVPHLVRADHLALRYQRFYQRLGNLLFGGTFLAVAAAATQALLTSTSWLLALLEGLLMTVLLVAVVYARRRRVHAHWISYRRLAERYRIALFQGIAALGISRLVGWDRIDIDPPRDWVRRLFEEVWISRPTGTLAGSNPVQLRDFLLRAWLDDQFAYHVRTVRKYERRDRFLSRSVGILVGVALVVALARGIPGAGDGGTKDVLILLATVAPALATALSGIRAQREYLRNAENSRQMANHLKVLRRRMGMAEDLATIQNLTHTMGLLMLDENQDWYATMQPHDLEMPV